MRTLIAAAAAGMIAVSPAAAQDRPAGTQGIEARIAAGIVWHGAVFGDDSPKSSKGIRPVVSGIVRTRADKGAGVTLEATLEPFGVQNPHFDERLHNLNLLVGVEIGRTFVVRPALGMAVQFWSGSRAESGISPAISAGLSFGHRRKAEVIARAAFAPGVGSLMAGVQLPFLASR
jgi:hypothetical protein